MVFFRCLLLLGLSLSATDGFSQWYKEDTFTKDGDKVTVVCNGQGPSVLQARSEALSQCDMFISRYLTEEVEVNTKSVETLHSSFHYSEINTKNKLSNLRCQPQKEAIVEREGFFSLWVKCEYNLKKASLNAIPVKASTKKKVKVAKDKILFLSTIPKCQSIFISGDTPRTLECKSNPILIEVLSGDLEMGIVADGYAIKKVMLADINKEELSITMEK